MIVLHSNYHTKNTIEILFFIFGHEFKLAITYYFVGIVCFVSVYPFHSI